MFDFADQELLEECCDAEGREFSHPTLTLPQFGTPLIILVGFRPFFLVWRGEKKVFCPLPLSEKPLFNGKMSQVVPGQGDFGGWAHAPSPGSS